MTMSEFELPGFRFHPTEQELVEFYLHNMAKGKKICFDVIGFLNIYHYDPGELPKLAKNGEREWYFFVPRDRKVGSGGRPNRTTANGFWKATGSDRKIVSLTGHKKVISLRKTLVFYEGRAPQGKKTDWVMNEYRLPDNSPLSKGVVLCKIYRKATSLRVLEQRAAMEETGFGKSILRPSADPTVVSFSPRQQDFHEEKTGTALNVRNLVFKKEEQEVCEMEESSVERERTISVSEKMASGIGRESRSERWPLPELQVPKYTMEWTQDSLWAQLNSPYPWLQFQTLTPCANIINFS